MRLELEGKPVRAHAGESVAVALYAGGHRVLSRSLKYHRPRAFFCLEGHCGGCLMRIDGVPNQRACMEPCRDGLEVAGQNAYPAPDLDVLELVDWLFPKGMNHHTLMTGSSLFNSVANKVVRQLSGLGQLPDRPVEHVVAATREAPEVLVIGAGPAGLAAATEAARAGAHTVLIDEHARPGGSLLCDPGYGVQDAAERARAARAQGVDIRLSCTAIGYYPEDSIPSLAVAGPHGLMLLSAQRYVYATGGYAVNRLFSDNDRPGVVAARAAGRMLVSHGIKPGNRVCVAFDRGDRYAERLALALEHAGCEVTRAIAPHAHLVQAHGRSWITSVDIEYTRGQDKRGPKQRLDCDLLAVSAVPAPASEAPRQHGCEVDFRPDDGGFAVVVDERGRTSVPDVLACGDVCGYMGPDAATRMGETAGRQAAVSLGQGGDGQRP